MKATLHLLVCAFLASSIFEARAYAATTGTDPKPFYGADHSNQESRPVSERWLVLLVGSLAVTGIITLVPRRRF